MVRTETLDTHTQSVDHEKDLKAYLDRYSAWLNISKLKPKEKQEWEQFKSNLDEWDLSGAVESIRTAGISKKENEKDNLKKFTLLASAFMTRIPGTAMKFKIDFTGNKTAYWKIGLGDMLSPEVEKIKKTTSDGQEIIGRRRVHPQTHRVGYFEEEALNNGEFIYIPIFTDDEVEILETVSSTQSIDRRTMQENVALYQQGGATDDASMGKEILYDAEDRNVSPSMKSAASKRTRKRLGKTIRELEAQREPIIVLGPEKIRKLRQRVVDAAVKVAGTNHFNKPFKRIKELRGGVLGCAYVATSILIDAGLGIHPTNPNAVVWGTDSSEHYMKQKGWTQIRNPGQEDVEPGDVIMWGRLKGRTKQTPTGPQYVKGRRHIGIALNSNECVSNSSRAKPRPRPKRHKIFTGRGVESIWKPPGTVSARTRVQTRGPREGNLRREVRRRPTRTTPRRAPSAPTAIRNILKEAPSAQIDHAMNTNILKKATRYRSVINAAAKKNNIPPELIMAVAQQESGFKTNLLSGAGAGGIMQFMPATGRGYGMHVPRGAEKEFSWKQNRSGRQYKKYHWLPGDQRLDPILSFKKAAKMLSDLLGSVRKGKHLPKSQWKRTIPEALACYNWGGGNVNAFKRGRKSMPRETRNYISTNPKKAAYGKYLSLMAAQS